MVQGRGVAASLHIRLALGFRTQGSAALLGVSKEEKPCSLCNLVLMASQETKATFPIWKLHTGFLSQGGALSGSVSRASTTSAQRPRLLLCSQQVSLQSFLCSKPECGRTAPRKLKASFFSVSPPPTPTQETVFFYLYLTTSCVFIVESLTHSKTATT